MHNLIVQNEICAFYLDLINILFEVFFHEPCGFLSYIAFCELCYQSSAYIFHTQMSKATYVS